MENQLTILAESLEKKIKVLEEIQKYNQLQEQAFSNGQMKLEDFDEAVEEKGRLIEQLERLDDGFEALYARIAKQLEGNREQYRNEIRNLQQQIARITEMSVTIQAQEKRNKHLIEQFFSRERSELHQTRKNSKAVHDYYRGLKSANYAQPQYYDSKK